MPTKFPDRKWQVTYLFGMEFITCSILTSDGKVCQATNDVLQYTSKYHKSSCALDFIRAYNVQSCDHDGVFT